MSARTQEQINADLFDEVKSLQKENAKLTELLEFALAGLKSAPHSWGLDITLVKKIERAVIRDRQLEDAMNVEYQPKGSMCASCFKRLRDCSQYDFSKMRKISKVSDGIVIVRCSHYERIKDAVGEHEAK